MKNVWIHKKCLKKTNSGTSETDDHYLYQILRHGINLTIISFYRNCLLENHHIMNLNGNIEFKLWGLCI